MLCHSMPLYRNDIYRSYTPKVQQQHLDKSQKKKKQVYLLSFSLLLYVRYCIIEHEQLPLARVPHKFSLKEKKKKNDKSQVISAVIVASVSFYEITNVNFRVYA